MEEHALDITSTVGVIVCRRFVIKSSCGDSSSKCFLLAEVMPAIIPGEDAMLSAGGVQTITSPGLCGIASFPLSVGSNGHI